MTEVSGAGAVIDTGTGTGAVGIDTGTAITAELVRGIAPVRPDSGHKNDFGHVVVCAGSKYMTGALVLASSSALRSGAGLVTAFSCEEALLPVRTGLPCAMTAAWGPDVVSSLKAADRLISRSNSCAIGPGFDESDLRSKALVLEFIENAPSLVIDAGALNIISRHREELLPAVAARKASGLAPAVLTPHVGEMGRLLGGEVTHEACVQFARENTCLLILKNNKTTIYTPHDTWYSIQGDNSGMAKGGSGDALTGLIAGLLAQGVNPCGAGIAGVFLHSLAGKIASREVGKRAMLPTDVINALPEAFRESGW